MFVAPHSSVADREVPILAVCLGREFDTKRLARDLPGNVVFSKWEEPVEVNVHGVRAFVYAFGTVVFLSGRTKTVESFVRQLKKYVEGRVSEYWEEYAWIRTRKRPEEYVGKVEIDGVRIYVGDDAIYAPELPKKALKIVTFVLAQSAALSRMEEYADSVSERMDSVLETLREKKGLSRVLSVRTTNRTLIDALRARNALMNDLLILEIPDLVLESEEHEKLFKYVRSVFDVDERAAAVEKKLDTVVDTANVVSDILLQDVFLLLEFLIVLFFFIEVVALFAGLW